MPISMDDVNEIVQLHDKIQKQIDAAFEAADLLEELEWEGEVLGPYGMAEGRGACPLCDEQRSDGHKPDCRLAIVLKKVKGE